MSASYNGDISIMQWLVEDGRADVNMQDKVSHVKACAFAGFASDLVCAVDRMDEQR